MTSVHPRQCSFEACERHPITKGFCNAHYLQFRKGKPLTPVRDPSTFGEWGVWISTSKGYVVRHKYTKAGTTTQYQHRVVMEEHLQRPLHAHETVHHINGQRDDNRLENLELWSKAQPCGQRVPEKIAWMTEFLAEYGYSVVPTAELDS